jgi:hypothetical protein
MALRTTIAKWAPLRSPAVKYSLITLALGLWCYGLVDQLYSSAATMKYLLMTLLMTLLMVVLAAL